MIIVFVLKPFILISLMILLLQYCNHLVRPLILYLIYGFGMVTCTVSPLSRFTAHLLPVYRATYKCTNERVGVFLARRSVQHLVSPYFPHLIICHHLVSIFRCLYRTWPWSVCKECNYFWLWIVLYGSRSFSCRWTNFFYFCHNSF